MSWLIVRVAVMRNPGLGWSVLCAAALVLVAHAPGAAPPRADEARIQALQEQVDALEQELARLDAARDPAAQQQAMRDHWSMMQEHMRFMRQMPGMGARGCGDWMMMDPGAMGGGLGGRGMGNCAMMGHGMGQGMGRGMRGSGPAWAPPAGIEPSAYRRQMRGHMQQMHSRMGAISAEPDPEKRQALMREHYRTMYRDMQTMRGMGWMWAPGSAASLPEANSRGARLVSRYCSQCHATPSPTLHTHSEWTAVTQRMSTHIGQAEVPAGSDVLVPSTSELDALTDYLRRHAKSEP